MALDRILEFLTTLGLSYNRTFARRTRVRHGLPEPDERSDEGGDWVDEDREEEPVNWNDWFFNPEEPGIRLGDIPIDGMEDWL